MLRNAVCRYEGHRSRSHILRTTQKGLLGRNSWVLLRKREGRLRVILSKVRQRLDELLRQIGLKRLLLRKHKRVARVLILMKKIIEHSKSTT